MASRDLRAQQRLPKRGSRVVNGVIDAGYRGPADEIKNQVLNVTDAPLQIRRGDRLAQGTLLRAPRIE